MRTTERATIYQTKPSQVIYSLVLIIMTKQTNHRLGTILAVFVTAISMSSVFPVVSFAQTATTTDQGGTTSTTTNETVGTTTPQVTASPENSYFTCNDGIDNDLDGTMDVLDIECLLFRPTVTVTTQVIGGTATVSDFLFNALFGTTMSATTTGSGVGVDMTWPFIGTWQITPLPVTDYSTTFGQDCGSTGIFEMFWNTHKNCLLINTFGGAGTSTATTTDSTTDGTTATTTATSTDTGTSTTTPPVVATSTETTTTTTTTNTNTNGGGAIPPQCADGSDNDGDGLADLNDPGCDDSLDNSETDSLVGVLTTPPDDGTGTTTATTTPTIETGEGEVLGVATSTAVCTPLISKYLRPWGSNNTVQVKTLQNFLNVHEGENIEETGFFGRATRAAVERFQLKYADEILLPWLEFGHKSIEIPTGLVYKTTLWKINSIVCADKKAEELPKPQLP